MAPSQVMIRSPTKIPIQIWERIYSLTVGDLRRCGKSDIFIWMIYSQTRRNRFLVLSSSHYFSLFLSLFLSFYLSFSLSLPSLSPSQSLPLHTIILSLPLPLFLFSIFLLAIFLSLFHITEIFSIDQTSNMRTNQYIITSHTRWWQFKQMLCFTVGVID